MMIEADYAQTDAAFGASRGTRNVGDESLLVKFYLNPVPDKKKTAEEGRPIYKEKVYIDIRQPGNKTSGVNRPLRPTDIDRFPEHYSRFMARQDQEVYEGTPLSEWPGMTRAQVEEMKYFNVFTVEQLANLSDSNSGNFKMGLNTLKAKASAYLEMSKDNAGAEALIAAEKKNNELEAKLAELTARMDSMDAPKKRRKRRTPAEMAKARKAEEENIFEELQE